jgi:pimeloyl-ACP methyl ester carboxylesterase
VAALPVGPICPVAWHITHFALAKPTARGPSRRFVVVINLAYDDSGKGEPVVFIAGHGGAGRTWHLHQVPAFRAAGYRVITFDNRGVGATENAEGFTTQTMVADTAALIESLDAAPARVVAASMGAYIAQELMLARPDLVSKAVLMGTRGRLDQVREFFHKAEAEMFASGIELPPSYDAKIRLLESFSPKTLNDDAAVADWITMFTMWPTKPTPGTRCQLAIAPRNNRLPAYRSITAPVLVIGFADDQMTPPHLSREVADAMPNGRYLQIADAGHLGFLERPEEVNAAALQFFAGMAV